MRELKHLLKRPVGDPDVIVRVHTKAVRFQKAIFSPGRHQFPGIAIEAENCRDSDGMSLIGSPGIFRAMKDEHMIVGIDGDTGHLTENHPVRKNGPAVNDSVRFGRFQLRGCADRA